MTSNQNNKNSGGITVTTVPITNQHWKWINIPGTHQGQWVQVPWSGGPPHQSSFDDEDLAVPVEEKKPVGNGCTCVRCLEFYPYAESNQEDGTLICYPCRKGW